MIYGLIDCNNFFATCERAFNPALWGKPVVVLSNNDGCVISRSYEAKDLGIPMGCPAFKIKEYTDASKVIMISGRHQLYGDISARIMSIVGHHVEKIEIYSIDEAFFRMPYGDDERNTEFALMLTRKIYQYTGISVSIGFAPTRTLAKVASHLAKKKRTLNENVYALTDKIDIEMQLAMLPIRDVWGIGRKTAESLKSQRINTALDFVRMPSVFVRRRYTVTGYRTQCELKGEDCSAMSAATIAHQSIMTSRSFGKTISGKQDLNDAIVSFASMSAKRLRSQNSIASSVTAFVASDRFSVTEPYYSNSCEIKLPTPSSSTLEIVKYAVMAMNNIYRPGVNYKKAGVLLSGIRPCTAVQQNLFAEVDLNKHNKLMQIVDQINSKTGSYCVGLAPDQASHKWAPSKKFQSAPKSSLHIFSAMVVPQESQSTNIDID